MAMTPDQDRERSEKIRIILDQEVQDGKDLADDARKMAAFLLRERKEYLPGDVQQQVRFEVLLGAEQVFSTIDFLVSLNGRPAMIIKCAAGSLSSRERQAVAAARVFSSPPPPVAVVADPLTAVVLNTADGKTIGEGFGAIPIRSQLLEILAASPAAPFSPERIEKEKRILLAFDAIQCHVPQGGDGGVTIGEPET